MEGCREQLDTTTKCGDRSFEEYGILTTYCSNCYESRKLVEVVDTLSEPPNVPKPWSSDLLALTSLIIGLILIFGG